VTVPASVRDKALLLQNEIRRLEAGAQGEDQAKRIARRVAEVETALATLSNHVRAARSLQRHTTATLTLTGLEAGRDDLARRAAGSIPGDTAFIAARRKIESRTSELAGEVQVNWKAWTDEQLSSLSPGRIAMLDVERQVPARTMLRRLRTLAAATVVSAADVSEFAAAVEGLREEIDEVGDGPEALLNIADRLSRGAVLLSEVSDEEIALLREYGLDREIELRRKGA
jgi:hypothetical protein